MKHLTFKQISKQNSKWFKRISEWIPENQLGLINAYSFLLYWLMIIEPSYILQICNDIIRFFYDKNRTSIVYWIFGPNLTVRDQDGWKMKHLLRCKDRQKTRGCVCNLFSIALTAQSDIQTPKQDQSHNSIKLHIPTSNHNNSEH